MTKTKEEMYFEAIVNKVKKERKEYVEETNIHKLTEKAKLAYEASLKVFDGFVMEVTKPENMELTGDKFVTLSVSKEKVDELFNKIYGSVDKGAVQNMVHKMHHMYLEDMEGRTDTIDVGVGDKFETIMYKYEVK